MKKCVRRDIHKQAIVNGILETFTEPARYGGGDGLQDYVLFKSVLDYAAKRYSLNYWRGVTNIKQRFSMAVASGAVNPDNCKVVSNKTGLFRYIHKDDVGKLVRWIVMNPTVFPITPGVTYVEPSVEDAVNMICAAEPPVTEVQVVEQPAATPEPAAAAAAAADKGAALERLKEHIELSVNAAVERHLGDVNPSKIMKRIDVLADCYADITRSANYLRDQTDTLKSTNEALRNEIEQLRKRNDKLIRENLVLGTHIVPKVDVAGPVGAVEAPKPSFFQRWFYGAAK